MVRGRLFKVSYLNARKTQENRSVGCTSPTHHPTPRTPQTVYFHFVSTQPVTHDLDYNCAFLIFILLAILTTVTGTIYIRFICNKRLLQGLAIYYSNLQTSQVFIINCNVSNLIRLL